MHNLVFHMRTCTLKFCVALDLVDLSILLLWYNVLDMQVEGLTGRSPHSAVIGLQLKQSSGSTEKTFW